MGYRSDLIGVVGENLARARLQALGWRVPDEDFLGGNTPDLDLTATSPDGSITVEIQVKTTTTDGKISWQKPGREQVDPWIEQAAAKGHLAAFVMIRADEKSVWVERDLHRRGFFFPEPEIMQVTAMTAQDFGDLVDQRRAEYGQLKRQRLYRGQGVIGEPLSPDKMKVPVIVDDGQPLEDFLSWLEQLPPDARLVLATSLFDDVTAALREHGSATLDEHCYYFRCHTVMRYAPVRFRAGVRTELGDL
jgi:hypothetical protein